ncbi:hypothetical protein [Pseudoroseicyclus aestuarii]|uniref:hypothetical protein n=1 Tax=Pseudoroseicyclus aestuarii TaxID=1795041 RepID=UPI0011B5C35E|nr:hypothetical protein [Pseudoroseicyclus aestuarii]
MSHIPFHEKKVSALSNKGLIDRKRYAISLACGPQNPVDVAYSSVGEYHIGKGILITIGYSIFVIRKDQSSLSGGTVSLGLMLAVETWAQARGSSEVFLHFTSGEEADLAERVMIPSGTPR